MKEDLKKKKQKRDAKVEDKERKMENINELADHKREEILNKLEELELRRRKYIHEREIKLKEYASKESEKYERFLINKDKIHFNATKNHKGILNKQNEFIQRATQKESSLELNKQNI